MDVNITLYTHYAPKSKMRTKMCLYDRLKYAKDKKEELRPDSQAE